MADPRKRTWWKHEPFFLNVSWETWAKNNCYVFPYVYRNDFIMFFLGVCACPQRGNEPLMTKKGSFHHIFLQITLVKHWIETLLMFLPMFSKNKHWKNIPYVYTMFLSWDRRSQDGFPAVWAELASEELRRANSQRMPVSMAKYPYAFRYVLMF